MKTGLKKTEKETVICFNEADNLIYVMTHNTDLRNRLLAYAQKYPGACWQIDDDEKGGLAFEIRKGRLSFRLSAPYSEERRAVSRRNGRNYGFGERKE